MKYRPDIDALRTVAVGTVVLSHLGIAGFSGGFTGVDIFFVISGFLITSFLLQRAAAGRISLSEFYFRRARRILPMALLVLAGTTLAALLLFNQIKALQVATDSYWASLFMANLHLIQQSTDYFNQAFAQSPVQHYWSLAVEEQFYLLFPLALIFTIKAVAKFKSVSWLSVFTILVAFASAGSLAWAVVQGATDSSVAYFSSATRAYELGIGALLAIVQFQGKKLQSKFSTVMAVTGLALMTAATVFLTGEQSFPSYLALLPTLGAAAFIAADVANNKVALVSRIFTARPMVYLGKISFSIYLIHWPLVVFIPAISPDFSETWMYAPTVILATLALSALGHRFVETPFRKIEMPKRRANSKSRLVFIGSVTASLLLVASSSLAMTGGTLNTANSPFASGSDTVDKYEPNASGNTPTPTPSSTGSASPSASPTASGTPTTNPSSTPTITPTTKPTDEPTEPPKPPAEPKLAALLDTWLPKVAAGLELTTVPDDLDPPIAALLSQRGAQWAQCMDPGYHQPTCTYGSASAKYTAVIIGDSYALAVYPMVIEALGLKNWHIIGLNRRECMVSDITPWPWSGERIDVDCLDHRAWVNQYIKQLKPDLVVLSDQPQHPIADGNKKAEDNHHELWAEGLESALNSLSRISKNLVYFGVPTTQQGLVDCVQAGGRLGERCTGKTSWLARYVQTQSEMSIKYDIPFINPNEWICEDGRCPSIIEKTPVYWDGSHFTQTFAAKIAPLFRAFLIENGLL